MKSIIATACGIVITILFLAGCKNNNPTNDKGIQPPTPKVDSNNATLLKINNQIFSIPSPIQTALLVKNSGYTYNKQMLNASDNYTKYDTKYKKALNLGIYGADLGYISLYDQTQDALLYLASIEKLATDIGVADVFNAGLVKRFQQNMGKQDSLLAMVSEAFGKSDAYFKNNKQNDISSLVLVGGWIESVYFAIQASNSTQGNQKDIIRRIAEQKISLQNMVKMLQPYSNQSPEYSQLIKELSSLSDIFENVEFVYNYIPPTVDAKSKMTTINSTSEVKIENGVLKEISDKIIAMRNQIAG
ncbi:MAG TPA: hypothetical protein VK783_09530 [Bacteroidia bacterium]|nr:hypothetical protein [Bacteroidia bacterium]